MTIFFLFQHTFRNENMCRGASGGHQRWRVWGRWMRAGGSLSTTTRQRVDAGVVAPDRRRRSGGRRRRGNNRVPEHQGAARLVQRAHPRSPPGRRSRAGKARPPAARATPWSRSPAAARAEEFDRAWAAFMDDHPRSPPPKTAALPGENVYETLDRLRLRRALDTARHRHVRQCVDTAAHHERRVDRRRRARPAGTNVDQPAFDSAAASVSLSITSESL